MRSDGWGMRIWKLVYPLVIYFGITAVLTTAVSGVWIWRLALANPNMSQENLFRLYEQQIMPNQVIIIFFIDIIVAAVLFIFYYRDSKRLMPVYKKTTIIHWIFIVILGIFGCLAGNFIVSLSGLIELFPDIYEELAEVQYSGEVWKQFIAIGVAAPVMEEVLFRGLIFRRLRTYCKFPLALVLSALIFAICHGNILQFIYAFLLGLLMAFLYEKFRNLMAPIVFHASANIFSILTTNYEVVNRIIMRNPFLAVGFSFAVVAGEVYLFSTVLEPANE